MAFKGTQKTVELFRYRCIIEDKYVQIHVDDGSCAAEKISSWNDAGGREIYHRAVEKSRTHTVARTDTNQAVEVWPTEKKARDRVDRLNELHKKYSNREQI